MRDKQFTNFWSCCTPTGVPGRAGSCVRVFRIVGWVAVVCTLFALLAHYGINYSLTRDSYDGFSEILRLEPGQEHFFPPVTICANGPGLKVNLTKCVATGCVYPADYDICSYEITNVTSSMLCLSLSLRFDYFRLTLLTKSTNLLCN